MNLHLIGYRGTGKSTIAQRLSLLLGWPWLDTDVEVELRAGKSIAAIFEQDGEAAFRDLEAGVIAELCRGDRQVLGLGGGAVLREENRRVIRASGKCVWLTASPETIYERLTADPSTGRRRPNLTAAGGLDEIRQLLAGRAPLYEECADLIVHTEGRTPTQVAETIADWGSRTLDATPDAG